MSDFTNKGRAKNKLKMNQEGLRKQQEQQEMEQAAINRQQIEAQARDSARQSRNLGMSYSIAIEKGLIDSGLVAEGGNFNETELREMIIDRAEYFQTYILGGKAALEPKAEQVTIENVTTDQTD